METLIYMIIIVVIGLLLAFLLNLSIKFLAKELEKKKLKDKDNLEEITMTPKEQIKECKKIIAQLKKDIGSFEASSVIDNSYEEYVKQFTNYLNFYKDILDSLQELEDIKRENNKLKVMLYGKRPEYIIELENELSKQLGLEDNKNDK